MKKNQKNKQHKKLKIKNTKKNIIYLLIGKLFVNISLYLIALQTSYKVLMFIIDNCITTLK